MSVDPGVLSVGAFQGHPEHRELLDELCSLWVDIAPRFGAVAARFPESLRKRRFVAGFWAPEVFFPSPDGREGWYRDLPESPRTRVQLDSRTYGVIHDAHRVPVRVTGGGSGLDAMLLSLVSPARFWSPELPEVEATLTSRGADDPWVLSRTWVRGMLGTYALDHRTRRALSAFLLLLCLALPAGAQTLAGTVSRVTDGDTLVVGKARVRLHGIDAPEGSQACVAPNRQAYRCGDSSEGFLARMAPPGSAITCEVLDADRYGRLVARCLVAGRDLSAWMVRSGWAVAFRRYSLDYVVLEDEARAAHRGMWAGSFVVPELWRGGVR